MACDLSQEVGRSLMHISRQLSCHPFCGYFLTYTLIPFFLLYIISIMLQCSHCVLSLICLKYVSLRISLFLPFVCCGIRTKVSPFHYHYSISFMKEVQRENTVLSIIVRAISVYYTGVVVRMRRNFVWLNIREHFRYWLHCGRSNSVHYSQQ